jgi:ATP-binding cassette subfamily A (ABC1) protein 3
MLIFSYATGALLYLVSSLLGYLGSKQIKDINTALDPFFRIFPGFNLGKGLVYIGTNRFDVSNWEWDFATRNSIYLFWTGAAYIIAVIGLEYLISVPKIASVLRNFFGIERDVPAEPEEEDSDVIAERQGIQSGELTGAIHVKGLRKVYGVKKSEQKLAVKDLWFNVPPGQCFGFLGVNGAGK